MIVSHRCHHSPRVAKMQHNRQHSLTHIEKRETLVKLLCNQVFFETANGYSIKYNLLLFSHKLFSWVNVKFWGEGWHVAKSDITAYPLLERRASYCGAAPLRFEKKKSIQNLAMHSFSLCIHHRLFYPFHSPQYLQDVKPLSCIPLLGCSVEDAPQELRRHPYFCLSQSKTTHTFSCSGLDVKQSWLTVLKVGVTGRIPAYRLSGINGKVNDGRVSSGEELIINGNKENHS